MRRDFKAFTVTIHKDIDNSAALGFPCVYLMYNGSSGRLVQPLSYENKGGIMGVYFTCLPPAASVKNIASDILLYCGRRGFEGVLTDMPPFEGSRDFMYDLCGILSSRGLVQYIHLLYGDLCDEAKLLVPSLCTEEPFEDRLSALCEKYSPSRLCLCAERLRHDFTMPSAEGDGSFLSDSDFRKLMGENPSYLSKKLICRYFTYAQNGIPHFVMFDDRETARQKIKAASDAGFCGAFALYPQWGRDIDYIFGRGAAPEGRPI